MPTGLYFLLQKLWHKKVLKFFYLCITNTESRKEIKTILSLFLPLRLTSEDSMTSLRTTFTQNCLSKFSDNFTAFCVLQMIDNVNNIR